MAHSVLDGVPGLGEFRRKAILRAFGSVKRLRAASVEEIAEVQGVGRRTAEAVHAALAETTPAPAVDPATGEILDEKLTELRPDTGPLPVGGFEAKP
jgi:excinuclease ABC subunit C